jgi:hypothetical protein
LQNIQRGSPAGLNTQETVPDESAPLTEARKTYSASSLFGNSRT